MSKEDISEKNISCRQHLYLSGVALCCVLEQDTCVFVLILVQPRKTHPDITEKLLTGTFRIKSNKIRGVARRLPKNEELRYLTVLLYFSAMIVNNKSADQTARAHTHLGEDGNSQAKCHVFTFALSLNTRDFVWQNILQGKTTIVLPAGCPCSVDSCTKGQSPLFPWAGTAVTDDWCIIYIKNELRLRILI